MSDGGQRVSRVAEGLVMLSILNLYLRRSKKIGEVQMCRVQKTKVAGGEV